MCGRYVTPREATIERHWNLTKGIPVFPRSWNVAPGGTVPLLRLHRETGELEVVMGRGRCIVPADGWYEWQARARKQPYFIHRADGAPVGFAGLVAVWKHPQTG